MAWRWQPRRHLPEPPADEGILPRSTSGPGIRLGRDGRFRIEGLVPGLKYGANAVEGPMTEVRSSGT